MGPPGLLGEVGSGKGEPHRQQSSLLKGYGSGSAIRLSARIELLEIKP